MKIAWGARLSQEALRKLVTYSASIGCDPSDLASCIQFESRWNPQATNPGSSAAGILQWIKRNYESYGLTREQLLAMSIEQQLDLVPRYFAPYVGRVGNLDDLYMAILLPTAIGKPSDAVVFASKTEAYEANRGLDFNHDGAITKAECVAVVRALREQGMAADKVGEWVVPTQPAAPIEDRSTTQPEEDRPVASILVNPLLSVLLGAASKALPVLGQILGAKNPAAQPLLQIAADTLVQATGAVNLQDGVEKVQKDPAVAAQVNAALAAQPDIKAYFELVAPLLDRVANYEQRAWEASEVSVANAANRNKEAAETPWTHDRALIVSMVILALVAMVVTTVLWKDALMLLVIPSGFQLPEGFQYGFSSDMQAFVIGAIVGSALTAVIAYFLGTNRQSAAKDATINTLAEASNARR